jgi:hypothetical protein
MPDARARRKRQMASDGILSAIIGNQTTMSLYGGWRRVATSLHRAEMRANRAARRSSLTP